MLFVNNKVKELTDIDVKELKRKFPESKFPLKISYHSTLIKDDRDNPGKKTKPKSYPIPCISHIRGSLGTETWRYSKNAPIVGDNGVLKFTHDHIDFNGNLSIQWGDWDLLYYMYEICPLVSNGKGAKHNRRGDFAYEITDPVVTSQATIDREIEESEIKMGILRDIPLEKVQSVAKAFLIANVDLMEEVIVRDTLYHKVFSDKKANFLKFKKYMENERDIRIPTLIQECLDRKILTLKSDEYFMKNEKGHLESFHKRQKGKVPNESLVNFVESRKDLIRLLEEKVKEEVPAE